jgi:uncharacterized membrane protein
MEYRVVFDVTQTWPDLKGPVLGLGLVCVALLAWKFRQSDVGWHGFFRPTPWVKTLFAGCYLVFAVLWTLVVTLVTLVSHHRAVEALRDGRARVVEGVVAGFDPMPAEGHKSERFTVGDVHFTYSDYEVIPGFHQARSHGGPVREGLPVRIHYSGPRSEAMILELEIRAE